MRLIDADLLLKELSKHSEECQNVYSGLFWMMQNQPTAYDIEKVVEQLESLEPFHVEGYGDVMVNLDDAIEIVKQGVVGTDDVCEWKYPKEIMDNVVFEVSCNSKPLKRGIVPNNFSYHDFKYCPYCGKKIKVEE